MRIIKFGLLSLFFLFILLTFIAALFPSHVRLSKAINLPNERQRIFALLKNDSAWHPAYRDSSSAKAFSGLQKKTMEQTDSTYVVQLQQMGRKPVISGWQLYGASAADSLTLQWYMDFRLGFLPWQKFSSLFYEHTYGDMMAKGLANFKEELAR